MRHALDKWISTLIALLLVLIALFSIYTSYNDIIPIFEGVTIALLATGIVLLLLLNARIEDMVPRRKR